MLRVVPDVLLEHREDGRAGLDQDQARLLLRDLGIVGSEVVPIELRQRSDALDTRWSAADHDDVQRSVVDKRRITVDRLPAIENVRLEADRVSEGVHREAVLPGTLGSEEVHGRAERDHEIVVVEGLSVQNSTVSVLGIDRRHVPRCTATFD